MLLAPAVAIIVAVFWLPAYGGLLQRQYVRDCKQAALTDRRQQLYALEQINMQLRSGDPVLVRRLAMSHAELWPANESIPGEKRRPQPLISLTPSRRPDRPNARLICAANRLADPRTRRGLLLLAAGAIAAAFVLFARPKTNAESLPTTA